MYRAADAARTADEASGDVMAIALPRIRPLTPAEATEQTLNLARVAYGGDAADEVNEPLDSDTDEPIGYGAEPNILDEEINSEATGFSSRIYGPLIAAGITDVEQLISRSEQELLGIKGVGPHAIVRIRQFLAEHELHLKGDEVQY